MKNQDDRQICESHDAPGRARAETNRCNAKKSTGPRDTTSTRYNAVKHGLLAEGVTELDSPETFTEFCAKIATKLQPIGEIEAFLARRIALGMVRLKRAELLEAEFVTAQLNPPVTEVDPDLETMLGRTAVIDPGLPARIPADALGVLANTIARYETAIENRLFRALNQLERMQRLRQGEKIPLPVSLDFAVHVDGQPLASFGNPPPAQGETEP